MHSLKNDVNLFVTMSITNNTKIQYLENLEILLPSYSSNTIPSDFHLFGPLKGHLGDKRFRLKNKVKIHLLR